MSELAPFVIQRPAGVPRLVYDSPHSGRRWPSDWETKATRDELRRGEDAYVDELLSEAPMLGAWVLAATFPRCYIDVNRAETDIDASLLSEPWPEPLQPTEKTARGLGLIRRFVVPGVEVLARPLTVNEVRSRIERVYRPYHAALRGLIDEQLRMRGAVWHVDWHSMKAVGNSMTPDGSGARRADFVVSDVHGKSAGPELTSLIVSTLRGLGYTVSVNDPYAGGTIVQTIGRPKDGVHSVQIEINRALYLDERTVQPSTGFDLLRRNLQHLTSVLADRAP